MSVILLISVFRFLLRSFHPLFPPIHFAVPHCPQLQPKALSITWKAPDYHFNLRSCCGPPNIPSL